MTFALNPTTDQTEAAFRQTAISQNGTEPEASHTAPTIAKSTSVKIAIGVVVGVVALALMVLAFCLLRRWKLKGYSERPKEPDATSTRNSDRTVYSGRDWKRLSEEKPPVPPKGHELHGVSSPVELAAPLPSRLTTLYGSDAKTNFI